MPVSNTLLTRQTGAGNTLVYLAMAILVAGATAVAVYLISQSRDEAAEADGVSQFGDTDPSLAEPPEERSIDFQDTPIERRRSASGRGTGPAGDEQDLFSREGRKLPLTDGLAGGTEASGATTTPDATPGRAVNAVDAFDYGVLDGRVRIGVFGKAAIPDYRVRVQGQTYLIEMPGEFRYVEEFSRTLNIGRFGVSSARLERDARGMRLSVQVTGGLEHEPFLIEDPRGLMIAFEPR